MSRATAGVADAADAVDGVAAVCFLDQRLQAPFGFDDLDLLVFIPADCDARGVISSVFQLVMPGE